MHTQLAQNTPPSSAFRRQRWPLRHLGLVAALLWGMVELVALQRSRWLHRRTLV